MSESAPRRKATYEDILAAPEHLVAEILDGELKLSPRPAAPHAEATSVLGMDIGAAFHRGRGGPGGWIILDEPELHFDDDVLVPDLAGWRRERLPHVGDAKFFTLAPDWACEVLSPSTQLIDRRTKMRIYAERGVPFLWLVDPLVRSLEVYVLDGASYRAQGTYGENERVRVPPFEALELELEALWPNTVTPLPESG
jgi:Uma2 family endonuclease